MNTLLPPDPSKHTARPAYMKTLRRSCGKNVTEWAALTGVSPSTVSRIEAGLQGYSYAQQYLFEATAASLPAWTELA